MFSRKLFNAFANFILSSSFPFFSPNQKHSLSKNHHSIAPTPNHLTKKRKREEKPLLSLFSPPFLRSNTPPLLSTHTISEPPIISLHPLFSAYLLYSLSPTIPINSDSPTYTTNQKPFPLNSFGVISLY